MSALCAQAVAPCVLPLAAYAVPSVLLAACACISAAASGWFFARLVAVALASARRAARRPLTLDDIVSDRTLCFAVLSAAAAVVSAAIALWMFPVLLVLAWVLAGRAPAMLEHRRREELRASCDAGLDVMADVVALGTRSGLSFDAALDVYCAKFDGELARQMRSARTAWVGGVASRSQALRDVADEMGSAGMRRFADTVVEAVRFGSPLADLLEKFSAEMRRERRAAVEQQVARAPVKMLVPLGTCILPALLIFVAGPVLLQFMSSGM